MSLAQPAPEGAPSLKELLARHLPDGVHPDRLGSYLAERGSVSRQAAADWLRDGAIPARRIEAILSGLQSPEALRPELYRRAGLGGVAKLVGA